jgi:hypothetical protein
MVDCEPGVDLQLVGLPPFEVRCTAAPDDPEVGEDEVVWRFGDGEVATGFVVSHTYTEVGQFSLGVEVGGEEPVRGIVTTCGVPAPVFTWEHLGGLEYRAVNETPPSPNCIDQLRWQVFRGKDRTREPVFEETIWEPRFEVPEEGDYTLVLTMGGLAGSAAAASRIEARGGLGDAERENSMAATCAGPSSGMWALPLVLFGIPARRRKRA